MPTFTLLMPMRNAAAHVTEALRSLDRQTARDWECLVIDDASTDDSVECVRNWPDHRVRLVRQPEPRGVAAALNLGLEQARGEYVARMDADDRCRPDRLARQREWLVRHPEIAIVGAWITCFGTGRRYVLSYPTGADCLEAFLLFDNPLAHPTVCWRRTALESLRLRYDERMPAAQDWELWIRCRAAGLKMDNVPRPLLEYRVHAQSVSRAREAESDQQALRLVGDQLRHLRPEATASEILFHRQVGHGAGLATRDQLEQAERWLMGLLACNNRATLFPRQGLRAAAGRVWFRVCWNSIGLGWWLVRRWRHSPLATGYRATPREQMILAFNAMRHGRRRHPRPPSGRLGTWTGAAGEFP